jgi:hypothetical protein
MIGVVVGQDDGCNSVQRATELYQRGAKLSEVAGKTAIDDRHRPVNIKDIPAHPLRAEPIHTIPDLIDRRRKLFSRIGSQGVTP